MGVLSFLLGRPTASRGVVLALGGGGARGLAHIGVLEVIEEAGIPVAGIAGTSAGAVIGAMWIALGSATAVGRRWREFLAADILKALPDVRLTPTVSTRDNPLLLFARRLRQSAVVALALERTSVITRAQLAEGISFLLPDVTIESLATPFAAVATDFVTGEPVILRRGSLHAAVLASCAIPAIVPPVPLAGRYLTDGGTVADVPVAQARVLAPRPLVAVSVGEGWAADDPERITLVQAMMRATNMTHRALRDAQLAGADLVIAPEVAAVHWSEFARFDEAVAAGRAAAERSLPRLRALARQRRGRRPAEERR
jgi:NTE family protein